MYKSFKKNIIHHFADDTNLIYASKKIATLENDRNYRLKIHVEWLCAKQANIKYCKNQTSYVSAPP